MWEGKKSSGINVKRQEKRQHIINIRCFILNVVKNCQNMHASPNFFFLCRLFMIMTLFQFSEDLVFGDNSTFSFCLRDIEKVVSRSESC